jgi:hypothetical protein
VVRSLELNPNDADVLNDFGQCLSFARRATEGAEVMRLDPHYPDYWVMQLGPLYFDARRYEDAISTLEKLHSNLALQTSLSARTDSKSFFAVLTNHDECNRWRTALRRQNPVR